MKGLEPVVLIEKPKPINPLAFNCYLYIASLVKLPPTALIKPNSPIQVGVVALFKYGSLPHYALVTKIGINSFTVQESNYHKGTFDTREVSLTDPHLLGFFDTQKSSN